MSFLHDTGAFLMCVVNQLAQLSLSSVNTEALAFQLFKQPRPQSLLSSSLEKGSWLRAVTCLRGANSTVGRVGPRLYFLLSAGGTNHECFFKMALTFLNNLHSFALSWQYIADLSLQVKQLIFLQPQLMKERPQRAVLHARPVSQ